jgi:hypothetical protein
MISAFIIFIYFWLNLSTKLDNFIPLYVYTINLFLLPNHKTTMSKSVIVLFFCTAFLSCTAQSQSKLGGILNKANDILNQTSKGLSTEEIGNGLKEALTVGIKNSSSVASSLDGYYKNDMIKILFPPEAQKLEQKLRQIGFGKQCDEFTMALNRGAEDAAKKAVPIFVKSITKMTFQDAMSILKGDKNAATNYLKKTTTSELMEAYGPVIDSSLTKTSATKYYGSLASTYNKLPFVTPVNADLKGYATQKAIDGLFLLVEAEERKIRENPVARVSDLLKKVFSQQ